MDAIPIEDFDRVLLSTDTTERKTQQYKIICAILTRKQKRVWDLYVQGYNQTEIAGIVGCSPQNVSGRIKSIYKKVKKVANDGE